MSDIPGTDATGTESKWYYERDGQKIGPFTLADLRQLYSAGTVRDGMVVVRGDGHRMRVGKPASQTPRPLLPRQAQPIVGREASAALPAEKRQTSSAPLDGGETANSAPADSQERKRLGEAAHLLWVALFIAGMWYKAVSKWSHSSVVLLLPVWIALGVALVTLVVFIVRAFASHQHVRDVVCHFDLARGQFIGGKTTEADKLGDGRDQEGARG